jgi:hypothetical protein
VQQALRKNTNTLFLTNYIKKAVSARQTGYAAHENSEITRIIIAYSSAIASKVQIFAGNLVNECFFVTKADFPTFIVHNCNPQKEENQQQCCKERNEKCADFTSVHGAFHFLCLC